MRGVIRSLVEDTSRGVNDALRAQLGRRGAIAARHAEAPAMLGRAFEGAIEVAPIP